MLSAALLDTIRRVDPVVLAGPLLGQRSAWTCRLRSW